ncbi:unnamed protein product [Arabidopsis thaliana]|uniref:Uncharacterized protein n=4 Tax=Arabidopsis TaxID=3701 RepID=A0A654FFF6_ARATH|eukprot:NP_001118830.1 hypothetical protein AT3G53294 [Arabidopsis thaliana]
MPACGGTLVLAIEFRANEINSLRSTNSELIWPLRFWKKKKK